MGQTFVVTKEPSGPQDGSRRMPTPDAEGIILDVPVHAEGEVVTVWRVQVADYQAQLRQLLKDDDDPEGVMTWIAGVRAHLIEIRSQSWDMRGSGVQHLRDRHLDPFMRELYVQYELASRRLSALEIEFKLTGPRGMT